MLINMSCCTNNLLPLENEIKILNTIWELIPVGERMKISVDDLVKALYLSKNEITLSLRRLQVNRHIDQWVTDGNSSASFIISIRQKGLDALQNVRQYA